MIRIKIDPPSSKIWKRWLRDCEKAKDALCNAYEKDGEIKISSIYKRKSIKDAYLAGKDGFFFGKCAYCESYIVDFQHGDIEHFRPKKGVTDENDNVVFIKDENGQQNPHPGYYWLAYDWTNLLLSCTACNQPSEKH